MEQNMGKQRVVDKAMSPVEIVRALQAGSITIAQAQGMFNGVMPIGDYKGIAAIFDLDKLVVQPLVAAERLYALDRIDARDIVTATFPAASALGTVIRARLGPVPADEVWFLNRLTLLSPAQIGAEAIIQVNFRVSIWAVPDVRTGTTVDADGRAYWPADQGTLILDTYTVDLPAQGELGEELRLPPEATITLVAIATGAAATTTTAATLTPFGRKGKLLVP